MSLFPRGFQPFVNVARGQQLCAFTKQGPGVGVASSTCAQQLSRTTGGAISSFPICQCPKCMGGAIDLSLYETRRSFFSCNKQESSLPRTNTSSGISRKCICGTCAVGMCKCAQCPCATPGLVGAGHRHFSSAAAAAASPLGSILALGEPREIDMDDARRKGLAWRAKQRGWLELDWLIGTFAQKYLANLDEPQLQKFEELLELDNPDLFKWLSAQEPAPEHVLQNDVYLMMAEYVNAEHPSIMRKMEGDNQNLS